jgi:ribonucleoside-diphosphate reductase alpha chain
MDYGVVVSAFFWKRFKNQGNITFFDPNEVPDLYDAYYKDIDLFEELYVKYEKRKDLKKKVMSAEEVFKGGVLKERTDTGRIYIVNIDNVQKQGPFDPRVNPIYQTNLCAEVLIPNKSFESLSDSEGRVALCTLGSINWGAFTSPDQLQPACRILVRALSNILAYQDYPSIQSFLSTQELEPLGVGVTNLAYWHAKRGLKYGTPQALAEVKSWMEHQAYYLTDATVDLAKERGACCDSSKTRYGKGLFPWELRAPAVNELTDFTPTLPWNELRTRMKRFGVRNALLMAIAPTESSSVVLSSTNGIELPMELISVKESKSGSITQVVPEYHELKDKYELMWDQPGCTNYLKTVAVLAAYVDQSISSNTFYSPANYPDGKIPATIIASDLMHAHRWGIKTHYYSLLNKRGAKHRLQQSTTTAAPEDDAGDCEACKL